ncbi:MAG: hypothetical protein ACE5NC_07190 [Anaerolineae bacterium]
MGSTVRAHWGICIAAGALLAGGCLSSSPAPASENPAPAAAAAPETSEPPPAGEPEGPTGAVAVTESLTDYAGRPCLYRDEMEHRRGIVNGILIHVRRQNAALDLDSPGEILWPSVAEAMPGIRFMLLATENYLDWVQEISPPEVGADFHRFEILTFQTMMESLEGYVGAEEAGDAEAWAASDAAWTRSLSFFQAGTRWLVAMADRC